MIYVYSCLKAERKKRRLKQGDVADLLGITRQQYQLYECGKREMPMHLFVSLARFYNVSLDYLAGITDVPRQLQV